jgi:hypothetical protein
MTPPYCGLPRLSHQLPVPEVVGFVEVGAVLAVVRGGAVVLVVVVVVVTVAVDVAVVDVLQEARTSDITMRQVSAIQIVPLFISSSCYLMENCWKIDFDLIYRPLFYFKSPDRHRR